ncbi:MAG: hypothetical protein WBB39_03380 [Candidatus Saccharimonadales bacterium]
MDGTYHVLGIASIVVLAIGLALLGVKWPLGIHRTFSQHAAQSRGLSVYYFVLFALTLPCISLMFLYDLTPKYGVSVTTNLLVIAASFLQISCTLFPETSGASLRAHRILSGLSAVLLPFALFTLSSAPNLPSHLQQIALLGCLIMFSSWIFAALYRYRFALVQQTVYFGVFFGTVIALGCNI